MQTHNIIMTTLFLAYSLFCIVCAIACPIIMYRKGGRVRDVFIGLMLGCFTYIGLIFVLLLVKEHEMKEFMKGAAKMPALFLWNPKDSGMVKEQRGTLFISDAGALFRAFGGSIKLKVKDVDYVTVYDYIEEGTLFPDELSASRIGNGSVVEVRPKVKRNQQHYLFIIGQAAAQQILTKLNASAGWQ